jgi:pimeloyl-ACP methyl ester carboxylesterase
LFFYVEGAIEMQTTNEGYVTSPDGTRLFFRRIGTDARAMLLPSTFPLLEHFAPLAGERTIIAYDLRNRGRSDRVASSRGVLDDVADLDAVRRHFELEQVDVLGHSYMGLTAILYALEHTAHVARVVQIGPIPPFAGRKYPSHLSRAEETLREISLHFAKTQNEAELWPLLRALYVVEPNDAAKLDWPLIESPIAVMKHWVENLAPSIERLALNAEKLAAVRVPVLTIHGDQDRHAPYGGGREWALVLPNARLLTIERAAHVPWIEAPERVLGAISDFLAGDWPSSAEHVRTLDRSAQ